MNNTPPKTESELMRDALRLLKPRWDEQDHMKKMADQHTLDHHAAALIEVGLHHHDTHVQALVEAARVFADYMHTDEGRMDQNQKGEALPDDQGVGWIYLTHGDFHLPKQGDCLILWNERHDDIQVQALVETARALLCAPTEACGRFDQFSEFRPMLSDPVSFEKAQLAAALSAFHQEGGE